MGQGSLYRHFPTRQDLAAAVVARSMERLRTLAADHPGADGFAVLWRAVVDQLVHTGGFLDAALGPRGEVGGTVPAEELAALLAEPLALAAAEGRVDAGLTVPDVMLVLTMVHGAVHRLGDERERRATAYRALALVGGDWPRPTGPRSDRPGQAEATRSSAATAMWRAPRRPKTEAGAIVEPGPG
ncbi:hypothetical protein BJF81_08320 [Ornithinimicrobium sp. CNJ-824]|uniref:hypothetical protein n=1 Tax=Ornithinimicrobium sp. CNJ-824 TaxID=1904966 RepID=UPI00096126B5|nr:hypothetical protein [Ornithinimicrobium sp. CNJ-824]OLT19523.1 hypothetical protein BJF81_08320 [Ornithinimicrobium sp. CNJ-824]